MLEELWQQDGAKLLSIRDCRRDDRARQPSSASREPDLAGRTKERLAVLGPINQGIR